LQAFIIIIFIIENNCRRVNDRIMEHYQRREDEARELPLPLLPAVAAVQELGVRLQMLNQLWMVSTMLSMVFIIHRYCYDLNLTIIRFGRIIGL
jgi:hypothetical protein